jgi:putative endonuclease
MQKRTDFLGEFAESVACNFLEEKGYKITHKRFKKKCGEIDIIAQNCGKIILIEVKYRKKFEDFEGIVNEKKLEKMHKTAQIIFGDSQNLQFDILFLNASYEVFHIENILTN